jgi:hypothetical protein
MSWTQEIGKEGAQMAKCLMMRQAVVAYAVRRVESIVRDKAIQMIE